jgi:hypothetical protein
MACKAMPGFHGVVGGGTLGRCSEKSGELNRIEKLWHLMKYTWMSVKCRNSQMLEEDVGEVLNNFGSTYEFAF